MPDSGADDLGYALAADDGGARMRYAAISGAIRWRNTSSWRT